MRVLACGLAAGTLLAGSMTAAQETQTYSYDAKGRLVGVDRTGSINNGVDADYCYDKADNRSQVKVASGTCVPSGGASNFAVGDGDGTEGGVILFTVNRYGDTSSAQTVAYASAGSTATSGTDFTAVSGTLSFAANDTAKTISVPATQDYLYEGAERLLINLSGATGGATISRAQGTGTIVDDEPPIPPGFSISDASASESGTLNFIVTRSGAASGSFSISYAAVSGSAVVGSDFYATSGTLTFGPSETTKTIAVALYNDTVIESTETMAVSLSSPTNNAAIVDGQGTGTITDDDSPPPPPPGLSVSNGSTIEGGTIVFTISRTDTTTAVGVSYATANDTTANNDLTHVSGTLSFAIGQASRTVTVQTTQDSRIEGNEDFFFNLSNPTGGVTIADGQGIGTIIDDESEACPTCRGTSSSSDPAPTDTEEPGAVDGPGL